MKYLRKLDQFGHPIELKFHKISGSYKTLVGGIISLCMFGVIAGAFYGNVERLITYNNPDII